MLSTAQAVHLQWFIKAKLFVFPPHLTVHECFSLAEGMSPLGKYEVS